MRFDILLPETLRSAVTAKGDDAAGSVSDRVCAVILEAHVSEVDARIARGGDEELIPF